MFEAGDIVSGFVIEAHLGGGGAADVYRVHPIDGMEPLALKVLHTDATNHARARDRFRREFAIASILHHPHILAVYGQGEVDAPKGGRTAELHSAAHAPAPSALWMTIQYVDGSASSALIPRTTPTPDITTIVRVTGQIADALDYAHSMDVIHRDVKPGNILLTADRLCAYLSDFGIAQLVDDVLPLARNGRVSGSIGYAAPELLQAQQLTPATDLYALACSVFEWLTGLPPYPRNTPFAITYAHLNDPSPKITTRTPWLPDSLNVVLAKALAKDPAARYHSCTEFADIVARTLQDVPVPVPEPHRRRWPWR